MNVSNATNSTGAADNTNLDVINILTYVFLAVVMFGIGAGVKPEHMRTTALYVAPELTGTVAPEQGYKGRPVDMWALGCVVYEMLHGKARQLTPEPSQAFCAEPWPQL
jgi:serine/threonine protein kinase